MRLIGRNCGNGADNTMDYLRIHVAARRRVRARKDILKLLTNSRPRQSKSKKTQRVVPRNYGIFARSLSFKVVRNEANESNEELSQALDDGPLVIPLNQSQTVERLLGPSKNGSPQKSRKRKLNVVSSKKRPKDTSAIQNCANDQNKRIRTSHNNKVRNKGLPSPSFINSNVLTEINGCDMNRINYSHTNQTNKITNNVKKRDYADKSNDCQTPVDLTLNLNSPVFESNLTTFDSLSGLNLQEISNDLTRSIDFQSAENQSRADHVQLSSGCLSNQSDFFQGTHEIGIQTENTNHSTQCSGYSLNMPEFSIQSNLSTAQTIETQQQKILKCTSHSFAFDESVSGNISMLSRMKPAPKKLCPITGHDERPLPDKPHTVNGFKDLSNFESNNDFETPASMIGKNSSFNSFSTLNGLNSGIESQNYLPLTKSMVIERMSLAARRTLDRLYASKGAQRLRKNVGLFQVSVAELRLAQAKTVQPIPPWFGDDTFE